MLLDLFNALWNAIVSGDKSKIELAYCDLENVGVDRKTARAIIVSMPRGMLENE